MLFIKSPQNTESPHFACWFGNFYEPYFSNRDACEKGINELKKIGMNTIILDSKLWSDFTAYFKGKKPSQYVQRQIEIIEVCKQLNLKVSFLALYYIGDNLYPVVYDNPPEYIDQPVDLHGNKIPGYRHWAQKQQKKQVEHCMNLHRKLAKDTICLARNENQQQKIPFYFYHDPVFTPSFDADGIDHYLKWLENQYTVEQINRRYKINANSIDELTPEQYWVHPEKAASRWDVPENDDYLYNTQVLLKYADNQKYKMSVMSNMFCDLASKLRQKEPRFYLYSSISQWKYFFNDCQNAWYWDASRRNVDIWEAGKSLDSPSFTTLPADCFSQPNSYVVSAELAMLRSAADFKDFIAGLFLGRYLYNDIYNVYSPMEMILTALAAGATDLYFYGYNGLDDGGNFGKWTDTQKYSIAKGLEFFTKFRKIAAKRLRTKKAAIVFPLATFALYHGGYDPVSYAKYRHDLLGWYRQFADLGINCDILHPAQVKQGQLNDYQVAIFPADPMYRLMPDEHFECAVNDFLKQDKMLLHSASCAVQHFIDIPSEKHEPDSINWRENITTDSSLFLTYPNGEIQAVYRSTDKPAIVSNKRGKAKVISFGFDYGYAYTSNIHQPAPAKYGKENHYPLTLLEYTPVEKLILEKFPGHRRSREIEIVEFENGTLVINHSPNDHKLETDTKAKIIKTLECEDKNLLAPRNCAFFPTCRTLKSTDKKRHIKLIN